MEGWPQGESWGKFQAGAEPGAPPRWHPLHDHCADVAVCLEALLQLRLWRRRLARTASLGDLAEIQVARLAALAALHDVGKFNQGFQRKVRPERSIRAGHVREALALLTDDVLRSRAATALDLDTLGGWFDSPMAAQVALLVAFSHHGQPVRPGDGPVPRALWEPGGGLDPLAGVATLVQSIRRWFPAAFESGRPKVPLNPEFQHALCGLVILADWIASDVRFFPYAQPGEADRLPRARAGARDALRELGIDPAEPRRALGPTLLSFEQTFGVPPRPLQTAIEDAPIPPDGGVLILEAETGSGKTEAALRYYLRLFQAGSVDGLYFALPTRSAASQIHERVRRSARAVFGESAPPVVLAVPGYIRVDDASAERLPDFQVLWNDDEQGRFRYRGWAAEHPKRYLAAPVAVGTVDQVLLSSLMVSHAHLRASSLVRHLLVVDEVHASDPYMTALLRDVLARHTAAGGYVLLMSATLGSDASTRLLRPRERSDPPPLADAIRRPYPALTASGAGVPLAIDASSAPKRVAIDWLATEDPSEVAGRALQAARAGARVLVVRNLVREAVATARGIEQLTTPDDPVLFRCESAVAVHHSRFGPEDRQALDSAVEKRLGKEAPARGVVVVTTQTAEQSLDIDADLLLTDLCPIDVLLQRLGRLHRHAGRGRPADFAEPRAIVLAPSGAADLGRHIRSAGLARGPSGLGTVYPDLAVLEATRRLLTDRPILDLPAMNRALVESATHPEALDRITEQLGGRWIEHRQRMVGARTGQVLLARGNLVRRDEPFDRLDVQFPSRSEAKIRTRLGEDDRLIRFDPAPLGPFGRVVRSLTIPHYLVAPETLPDATPEIVSQDGGVVRFRYGGRGFRYDRLGLRPLEADDEEE